MKENIEKSNVDGKALAFDEILKRLASYANSPGAKGVIDGLRPILSEEELRKNLRETTQARQMLDLVGTPPAPAMEFIEGLLDKAVRYELLLPEELEQIGMFLTAVKRMKEYLERGKGLQISLAFYEENLVLSEELRSELERCVRYGKIDDFASPALQDIRRKIVFSEEKIRERAEGLLRTQKKYMSEAFIVNRNGRICLPVKKDYKSRISGSVVDKSASGTTLFIEPESVAKYREEKELLEIEEDNEVRRIIYMLMEEINGQEEALRGNLRTLVKLDFIFAKGKLSVDMEGVEPKINTGRHIRLRGARHPLISRESCVPLDFELGGERRGIIITGPNTGGKTVAIKTVGLFSLMACCGLHLPCSEADICMNNQVLCDIGDGQNIEDNLSTFSSHITNVLEILHKATEESLVIMDELGSGTDPAEGMGIAVAVIEQLRLSGCLFLLTTHYPEVKSYAEKYKEIVNARMEFDRENLKPLYRMEIGKSGESCALYIAKRLGMPDCMLITAAKEAYGELKEELVKELGLEGEFFSGEKFFWEKPGKEDERENEKGNKKENQRDMVPVIIKKNSNSRIKPAAKKFTRGDSVTVLPEEVIGIVVNPEDERGDVLVQVKGEKITVNQKRLKLKVAAAELYPEDYDFSIIFDTVENRKARHKMEKGYQEDLVIYREKDFT